MQLLPTYAHQLRGSLYYLGFTKKACLIMIPCAGQSKNASMHKGTNLFNTIYCQFTLSPQVATVECLHDAL